MSVLSSHPWISHDLYNLLPPVESARILIDQPSQIAVNNKLAIVIPDLIEKVGTTLTHRHWLARKKESIIGVIENGKLCSELRSRTETTCPTTWAVIDNDLLAIEGIENPSKEVIEVAKKVQDNASKILPCLPFHPNQRCSTLSIAIDPRIYFHTGKKYFVEKNKQGKSIVSPLEKKELESARKIVTYISIDSPQIAEVSTENKNLSQQFCMQECEIDEGDGYHECYHAF